jgi:Heterokaryon incompatibility protein (HET)
MRLINVHTMEFEEFNGSSTPEYAILSHTWEKEEVSYAQFQEPSSQSMVGYRKIVYLSKQAQEDDLNYAWIDTCCIDKSSSSELTEAINSMFKWYKGAKFCYAYLEDIQDLNAAGLAVRLKQFDSPSYVASALTSRWFTRGWTLQELLAPPNVKFYNRKWEYIGDKYHLWEYISIQSGIPKLALLRPESIQSYSVANRMNWVSKRITTREEDIAYCLLGLFDINMPLLYGEGRKAFYRLQEEIIKVSDDDTIFAWDNPEQRYSVLGALAQSPAWFQDPDISRNTEDSLSNYSITNSGLRIQMPILRRGDQYYGVLKCSTKHSSFPSMPCPLGIPLFNAGKDKTYFRNGCVRLGDISQSSVAIETIYIIRESVPTISRCLWVADPSIQRLSWTVVPCTLKGSNFFWPSNSQTAELLWIEGEQEYAMLNFIVRDEKDQILLTVQFEHDLVEDKAKLTGRELNADEIPNVREPSSTHTGMRVFDWEVDERSSSLLRGILTRRGQSWIIIFQIVDSGSQEL